MGGLIMQKRTSLVSCPSVGDHAIRRSDAYRTLVIDHMVIRFTPKEYHIVLCLLEGNTVTDSYLIQEVLGSQDNPVFRHNLDKYIDNIRRKLSPFGLNIYRVMKYGYNLLAAVE